MKTKVAVVTVVALVLAVAPAYLLAGDANWQTGKLISTEQQKVSEGSTRTTTSDATVKEKRNQISENSTSTTTDNTEKYQLYTIESGDKIYVASEHLLFPWSKPASIQLGEQVKFTVEGGKIRFLDDDGKEHKASLVKTMLKSGS